MLQHDFQAVLDTSTQPREWLHMPGSSVEVELLNHSSEASQRFLAVPLSDLASVFGVGVLGYHNGFPYQNGSLLLEASDSRWYGALTAGRLRLCTVRTHSDPPVCFIPSSKHRQPQDCNRRRCHWHGGHGIETLGQLCYGDPTPPCPRSQHSYTIPPRRSAPLQLTLAMATYCRAFRRRAVAWGAVPATLCAGFTASPAARGSPSSPK